MVAPNEETFEGHIMEYECLILNTEKCITNNNIFQLKVQCELTIFISISFKYMQQQYQLI